MTPNMTESKPGAAQPPPVLALLPVPRTKRHSDIARRITGQNSGAVNGRWLPEGVRSEVDDLRKRHHRHLRAIASIQAEQQALERSWKRADERQEAMLDEAARTFSEPAADERPTDAERHAAFAPLEDREWAAFGALADFLDAAIQMLREHEDRWLAELRGELPALEQKRAEARRLLEEAKSAEHRVAATAVWLMRSADHDLGGLRFQPLPAEQPGTAWMGATEDTLRRHWAMLRPWNVGYEAPEDIPSRSRELSLDEARKIGAHHPDA